VDVDFEPDFSTWVGDLQVFPRGLELLFELVVPAVLVQVPQHWYGADVFSASAGLVGDEMAAVIVPAAEMADALLD